MTRIVDLREQFEIDDDPPRDLDVEVVHVPDARPLRRGATGWRSGPSRSAAPTQSAATEIVYLRFLEYCRPRLVEAFEAVATAPGGRSCSTATPARTAPASSRPCCCVSRAFRSRTIAEDYALSARSPPTAARCSGSPRRRARRSERVSSGSPPRRRRRCRPFSESIDRDYDGVQEYLLDGGLAPESARRARAAAAMRVIAVFGPTASGKSAVAEALARQDPRRAGLGRLGAALPRAVDPHQPVACGPRRGLGARPRGVGGRVPGARARGDRRRARRRADPGRRRRHRSVLPCCARRARRSAGAGRPAPASAGSASTTRRAPRRRTRCSPSAIPQAAAAVHPNDRRRVVRALELAEAGHSLRGDRLWAAETRQPTLIAGLDVPTDVLNERIEARTRAMFDAGVEDEVRRALDAAAVGDRPEDHGPARGRGAAAGRGGGRARRAYPAFRGATSGSGCAGSRASLACGPTGLPTRWRMRFSRWRAAGNEYLLAERSELGGPLTPERVRREVGSSDGILEVVSTGGDEAEIVIWNPDGSTAEMSGNGTRIAARWLAERSGADEVRIRVGPREVTARMLGDEVEQDIGPVEVYERERVAGLEVTAGLGRQSARRRRRRSGRHRARRAAARDPPALPGAHERAGRPRRSPGPRHGSRLGARGGRDALVRNECCRSRGRHARRGRGGRLVSRRRPPGEAGTWSCMADRARRTRRLTAVGVLGAFLAAVAAAASATEPVTLTVSPSARVEPGTSVRLTARARLGAGARIRITGRGVRVADCLRSPCVATYRGRASGAVPSKPRWLSAGKCVPSRAR